jgi:protein-disulfide isomerase/uncharacterized membrane protein
MAKIRIAVAAGLCVVGALLTVVLLSKHYGVPLLGEAVMAACGTGEGCDVVAQSRYSAFLGLPLAAWGLFFYGSMLALLLPELVRGDDDLPSAAPSLALVLTGTAIVLDVVLLSVQAFLIKAFCTFCLGTYAVNVALFAVLWAFGFSGIGEFALLPRYRASFASWVAATLAVFGLSVSLDMALRDRKALAGASILGIPLAPAPVSEATPAPAPGSIEEQLNQARAEAKKWKDTLDDEKRLNVYLTNKALSDFNESPVAKHDLSRAPQQGPKDAPMHVVSYSDFMCPFCRDLAQGLQNYLPRAGGQVQTHYKHFPLDSACNPQVGHAMHPGSCELSLAGICADEMGKFQEFHDKVFARPWDRATRDDALEIAASVGLDRNRVRACMDSQATKGLLAKDIAEGWKVGVGSTPTIFINGRKVPATNMFLLSLEEERKRLSLPTPTVPPQRPQR